MSVVKDRLNAIRERIAHAAERTGRDESDIRLIGVTKTRTVDEMREVAPYIDAIGENKVQEAEEKFNAWGDSLSPQWRMIGHLQSNKVRKALEIFDTIDSVDGIDIAERLNRVAGEVRPGKKLPILIEVNTAKEISKTGVLPKRFPALLDCVLALPNLELDGLMTVGPMSEDEGTVREAFKYLRFLLDDAQKRSGLCLPILSMGMSGDFEWGILEGSTMVRIGSALFGPRDYIRKPSLSFIARDRLGLEGLKSLED